MNRYSTWLHTRTFLADMITRYAADNQNLGDENAELRKKIAHKDDLLERALADHRQSNNFNQAVITGMQKQITDQKLQIDRFNSWRARYKSLIEFADEEPEDINPETEKDYIDQIVQNQVDRHDAEEAEYERNPDSPRSKAYFASFS